MFCGNCGKEIKEGANFCTNCGWKIPDVNGSMEKPEELRCSACGAILKADTEFCGNCGTKITNVKANSDQAGYSVNTISRARHGFTSFWLIFGIITCSITGLFYLFLPNLRNELNIYMSDGMITVYVFAMTVQVIGLVLLLRWKKIGFWIITVVSGVSLMINLTSGGSVLQTMGAIIGIVIYWGVLQLKKNEKTAWEQLE